MTRDRSRADAPRVFDSSPSRRRPGLRFGVAIACVAIGWVGRKLLTPVLGPTALPFITFFPMTALAAWYGGWWAGWTTSLLGAVIASWAFIAPVDALSIESTTDVVGSFVFVLSCLFIVGPMELMHQARARLAGEVERRHRVERELTEGRNLLGTTLTSIGDGVISTDDQGRVVFLNPVAEQLTGWTTAQAQGKPLATVFQIIDEESRQPAEDPTIRVLAEGCVVGLANHTILIAKDGAERPIEDSGAPIRDAAGQIVGVVLVFRDATQRRQWERLQRSYQEELERQVQKRTDMLRASEEHFRLLVDGATNHAIYMLDPEGRVASWNPGAERIKGYQDHEIIGQHFSRFFPPEDVGRKKPQRELEAAVREGRYEEEGWRVRKDGSRFWASVVITPLRDDQGHLRGFGKITRDMTERKRAEEISRRLVQEEAARQAAERHAAEIAQERERLRVTLHGIGDGVIATDDQGRVTMLNPVAESLTGWTTDEASGRPLSDVFHIINEMSRNTVENPVEKVLASGNIVGLANHTVLIAKDGVERPIDDSAAPIRDAQGRIIGVVLVFRDVTERRGMERRRADAEARMRSVVDHVVDGIITIDESGSIQTFNPAAEKLFGYRAEEVQGKNVSMLMPPPYREEHDEYLANYRRTRQPKIIGVGREVQGRRKDGSTFPMDLAVSEFTLGGARFFTGIVRDITERKRAEQALLEADRRKDEFLAILSHELRNPLAPIRMAVALLRKIGPPEPELQELRDIIDRQAGQMAMLLDDLLDMSRIASGKLVLRKEHVSLGLAVASAVESARPLIDSQRHQLNVEVPDEPIHVEGDLARLAQVFANLLNNAAKYTEKGGLISLTVERQGSNAVVRVKDTGIGIAPDQLPRIFEMYVQVDHSLERIRGGLGIGLSLVRRLVEMHNGSIEARSAGPGKGSEFIVRLPALATVASATARRQQPSDGRDATRYRILVADDNVDSANVLAKVLSRRGHDVRTVHDGPAAVEEARTFVPELAVLDIGMPKMSGYEVARRLRCDFGERIILVAMTGWGQEEDKRKAVEAGFDHHLTKPADHEAIERLLTVVRPAAP